MPVYRDPFTKGRLIIRFTVKFPPNNFIEPKKLEAVEKLLPPREEIIIPDDVEEHVLEEFDPHANNQRRYNQQHAHAYNDDDDSDGMGGQKVQCASH